ncbi:unnamed protein product [Medioppia subpectinata]|uniref:Uncharacterized protein n=1 Tax=Medioppia subpectinata TaxID=1979941 RepID=A0A7R9KRX7_9ACAR|nr:unnamed protein product [Medioppia subpectinata]CAG2108705.1 unnamed protein product [Medioppia subpectinata]
MKRMVNIIYVMETNKCHVIGYGPILNVAKYMRSILILYIKLYYKCDCEEIDAVEDVLNKMGVMVTDMQTNSQIVYSQENCSVVTIAVPVCVPSRDEVIMLLFDNPSKSNAKMVLYSNTRVEQNHKFKGVLELIPNRNNPINFVNKVEKVLVMVYKTTANHFAVIYPQWGLDCSRTPICKINLLSTKVEKSADSPDRQFCIASTREHSRVEAIQNCRSGLSALFSTFVDKRLILQMGVREQSSPHCGYITAK